MTVPVSSSFAGIARQVGIFIGAVVFVAVVGYSAGRFSLKVIPRADQATVDVPETPSLSVSALDSSRSSSPSDQPAVSNSGGTTISSGTTTAAATSVPITDFDVLSKDALGRAVHWGDKNESRSISIEDPDSVTFSPFPSRFARIKNDLFDLTNGTLQATIPGQFDRRPCVISLGGSKVVVVSYVTGGGATINVYSTQNSNSPPLELPVYSSSPHVEVMHFLDEELLLAGFHSGGGCRFIVWNTTSGKEVRRFQGEGIADGLCCLSANGRYLAMNSYEGFIVLDTASGDEVSRMTKKWQGKSILSICDGLAFSPNGAEIAAYDSGSSELMVWSIHGEMKLFKIIPNCQRIWQEKTNSVSWLPDGSGWLLSGRCLVQRDNLQMMWQLGEIDKNLAGDSNARLMDQNHVAAMYVSFHKDDRITVIPIPWEKIRAANQVLNDRTDLVVDQGVEVDVSLAVDTADPSKKDAVTQATFQLFQKRLTEGGLRIRKDAPIKLTFIHAENARKERSLFGGDNPGNEFRTSVSWSSGNEILWSHSFKPFVPSGQDLMGAGSFDSLEYARESVIHHYTHLAIPLRITKSSEHRLPLQTSFRDAKGRAAPWKP